mmetsp:Transcript_40083/g.119383  ORF Transcript_40083/g.119383 Transcript_40083/m.119383 type:complete len:256 (-) Transcript_40083:577-1344(-)
MLRCHGCEVRRDGHKGGQRWPQEHIDESLLCLRHVDCVAVAERRDRQAYRCLLVTLRAELRDDAFRPCAGKVEGPRRIGDVSKVHHHLVQQHAVSPLVQVRLRSQLHVECLQQIEVDCHVRGHHSFHDQLAHLLLVARRQQRQHIASWRCSGQLKSSADVIALVHRLVVVRRGSRVLAVYQEVVVHSQVSKVMHCRRHDDAKHFKFGNVFELFLEAGQDDRAGLCHVGRVDGVVVRVVQILGLHAPQEAFHSTPV